MNRGLSGITKRGREAILNTVLWILQIILAVNFLAVGVLHFIVPPGLPAPLNWMYDLPPILHWISGTSEILAAFGLILPGLTRIKPGLTPLAAAGLVVVMLGAAVWHLGRAEFLNIVPNLSLAALSGFVAHGRWMLHALPERSEPSPI